jgi:hypothetical protein
LLITSGACREAVPWTTPTGSIVLVDLALKFGTFFGYTKETRDSLAATEVGGQSYLGTQCHGVMWAAELDLPHGWPVAPPIVAGKVRETPFDMRLILSISASRGENL